MTPDIPDLYVSLVREFLGGEMTPDDFSLAVVKAYKREKTFFAEAEADAMNQLFYAAEGYCGDAELRDERDLDEGQLADAARDFLAFVEASQRDG